MDFQEEVVALSNISEALLRKLEPEPEHVKRYIEEECKRIQKEGWLKKEGDKPWIKTFEKDKYILKISLIHARRGENITGADLAFELKDKKVIFVQSKRVSSNGRIYFNRFQLQKLVELEWQICTFPLYSRIDFHEWIEIVYRFYHRYWPFLLPFYPCRATFYHLIMMNNGQIDERFFHTSEICFTLGGNKSINQSEFQNHGLRPEEFHRMFWECKIGGPDIREDIKREVFFLYSMFTNRLIIWLDVEKKI